MSNYEAGNILPAMSWKSQTDVNVMYIAMFMFVNLLTIVVKANHL